MLFSKDTVSLFSFSDSPLAVTLPPHSEQNLVPAGYSLPHPEQAKTTGATGFTSSTLPPHSEQNLVPTGYSLPHPVQTNFGASSF